LLKVYVREITRIVSHDTPAADVYFWLQGSAGILEAK
jgi:hypothetical protein